jgi:hypothetical protein
LSQSRLAHGDRKALPHKVFLACKYFHRYGFLGKFKIILGVAPWKRKGLGNTDLIFDTFGLRAKNLLAA